MCVHVCACVISAVSLFCFSLFPLSFFHLLDRQFDIWTQYSTSCEQTINRVPLHNKRRYCLAFSGGICRWSTALYNVLTRPLLLTRCLLLPTYWRFVVDGLFDVYFLLGEGSKIVIVVCFLIGVANNGNREMFKNKGVYWCW